MLKQRPGKGNGRLSFKEMILTCKEVVTDALTYQLRVYSYLTHLVCFKRSRVLFPCWPRPFCADVSTLMQILVRTKQLDQDPPSEVVQTNSGTVQFGVNTD